MLCFCFLFFKGPLNAFRRTLIQQAFDLLDKTNSGKVKITQIQDVYNASGHPEVKKGSKSDDDMLTEFLQTFGTFCTNSNITDGYVSFDHFLDYYAYISASI